MMLTSSAILNALLLIGFQTHMELNFAELKFENILHHLECVGKNYLIMSKDCQLSVNPSLVQTTWATAGFLLTAHKICMVTVISLGILILCGTLLYAISNIERSEIYNPDDEYAHVTPNDLTNITKLAEDMSKFIGEALLGFLIYHAVHAPSDLLLIFSESPCALLFNLVNHGTIYAGLLLGSVASLRVSYRNN